ncbi:DUF4248 domain-containing protein [Parabacteroides sp. AF17-28]|uniref:DUF4248 domain-containing protein n=1 Tax=Parabacteroides sp. AF17-28 TaxID=2292241 RepID=UPI000EFE361E|nr:DUF4248 domain-containing protein [Parabacteroides sp. AF17-28]RHR54931.1 DUF4248 domain-containing protein [Parabacteroides sp. AF17-28]
MDGIFKIKSFGWQELAILYAPGITPRAATQRLTMWVKNNQNLAESLKEKGWIKGQRLLTPVQVKLIVDYLGEP